MKRGETIKRGRKMRREFILAVALVLPMPSFAQQWVARYNGPANSTDWANAIAIDGSGNVYVTGMSMGSGTARDYATVKYNSEGVEQWARRYNGPGNGDDYAYAIAVDDSGNVYVTGVSKGSGTNDDYATVKYNSEGVEQWVARYNGQGDGYDGASAIAVDDSGNVYVTGYDGSDTSYDYATVKYNSEGVEQWVARYDGPANSWDYAYAIAVDGNYVYVTGCSGGDYATVKYNSEGVEQWVARYDGPANGYDEASAIAADGSGNVYVTGYSDSVGTNHDYATVKYNSEGVEQWVARYDRPGNYSDVAEAIAVDGSDNIYVTGWTQTYVAGWSKSSVANYGYAYDYATVKYNSEGVEQWVAIYNGPGNDYDLAEAIAVDGDYVYVTGYSEGLGTGYDYATIKYSCAGIEENRSQIIEDRRQKLEVYPNPSFGNSVIRYNLSEKTDIILKLYDISARLVQTIYSETQEKGEHEVSLGCATSLPGGIYFIRLETDELKAIKKLLIFK